MMFELGAYGFGIAVFSHEIHVERPELVGCGIDEEYPYVLSGEGVEIFDCAEDILFGVCCYDDAVRFDTGEVDVFHCEVAALAMGGVDVAVVI